MLKYLRGFINSEGGLQTMYIQHSCGWTEKQSLRVLADSMRSELRRYLKGKEEGN